MKVALPRKVRIVCTGAATRSMLGLLVTQDVALKTLVKVGHRPL